MSIWYVENILSCLIFVFHSVQRHNFTSPTIPLYFNSTRLKNLESSSSFLQKIAGGNPYKEYPGFFAYGPKFLMYPTIESGF